MCLSITAKATEDYADNEGLWNIYWEISADYGWNAACVTIFSKILNIFSQDMYPGYFLLSRGICPTFDLLI